MRNTPAKLPLEEEQAKAAEQMYLLMGKQVKSYQKTHHMGENSSVPMELAQALMESVEYTVNTAGGMQAHRNLEETFCAGQKILQKRHHEAKKLLVLVTGTTPQWQTDCRWEVLRYLGQYLEQYDPHHLAHIEPEGLFYPILIATPEYRGIDSCVFYLNVLWIENQIMAGIPECVLEAFWGRLPADALNPCEYLLTNGIGKVLLGTGLDPLGMEPEDYPRLYEKMAGATEETLRTAAGVLCQWLSLENEAACRYVAGVIPRFRAWLGSGGQKEYLEGLFV